MSLRSSLVGEGAPLLVSGADASLGREAKAAGRRLPAVFACAAVGGFVLVLVCFSVALPGSNHGAPSTAREGFVSDAAVMADAQGRSQTPRKYEHLPDEGFAENKDQATHTLAGDSAIWGNARADEDDDKETSARLGWVPDQAFMKESERLYNQINDAGVTQLDYENGSPRVRTSRRCVIRRRAVVPMTKPPKPMLKPKTATSIQQPTTTRRITRP
jgi:hypothetical protein